MYVDGRTATVRAATVDGRSVPAEPVDGGRWSFGLTFHAPPPDGLVLNLELVPVPAGGADAGGTGDGTGDGSGPGDGSAGQGGVRLRVLDGSDGLSGLPGFRPRPAGVGVAGTHTSELALLSRVVTV